LPRVLIHPTGSTSVLPPFVWRRSNNFTWYPGKQKRRSLFFEGRYEYMEANIQSGGPPGVSKASFNRWGGSFGVSYRF
jgi:hypothetical protein